MRESDLIARLRARVGLAPPGHTGIGDDACVWVPSGPTCLSVDGVVEGRHFTSSDEPWAVGRKAAAAALSDLAAMGARPLGAVVSLHCPEHWDAEIIMQGLLEELERHACYCYGGDSTAADQLVISVSVWGESGPGGRLVPRSAAMVGDLLLVTGHLGGSLRKGRHLAPQPRLEEGQWLACQDAVHAMMDISDGLASDAARLADASGCGCILLPKEVPCHPDIDPYRDPATQALCDGEDFELLLAVEASEWPSLAAKWPFPLPLTRVGWLIQEAGSYIEDPLGRLQPSPYQGFDHRL